MAKTKAPSPSVRIRELEKARKKAIKTKRGLTLTAEPMADLLGVSWVTLKKWCDTIPGFEASKAFVRGARGIDYEFKAVKTIDFLLRHFRQQAADAQKRSREIAEATGVKLPEDDDAGSIDEIRQRVSLTMTMVDAAERQGRYTLTEDMLAFIEGYNQAVTQGILGVRTRTDPNGNLPPAVRTAMDQELRRVAATVHAKATEFIEQRSEGLHKAGTG